MKESTSSKEDPLEKDHRARSNFIRKLVQRFSTVTEVPEAFLPSTPRRIVQFWDDIERLPTDVRECIDSWKKLEELGFELLFFDECKAKEFIRNRLGIRHERAFEKCYHPAMQSDYFRLCFILMEGGCYVDADDIYCGGDIEHIFNDGRLKIQPLCYDISTNEMVPLSVFTQPEANSLNWIFYFNNNPLISILGHPIIERALSNATTALEQSFYKQLPEIQSTTGPGNLSRSIFDHASTKNDIESILVVQHNWEETTTTKWSLSYRDDERNWRLSNQKKYKRSASQIKLAREK